MRSVIATLLVLAAVSAGRAGPPPADWDKWVPSQATAVLLIDSVALHRTPLATQQGWAKRAASGTPADVTSLPDNMATILIATDLSPANFDDTWRVAVMEATKGVSVPQLAKHEGGRIDTVRGQEVVVSPRNLVIVPVAEKVYAIRQPAERQALSRWLNDVQKGSGGGPSAYLRQAVTKPAAPIVAAMDLADAIDPNVLRQRLKGAGLPAATDLDGLAKLLGGLKGLTLTVNVTNAIEAEVRFDFSADASSIKPVLLSVTREALKAHGAELDDLANWQTEVSGMTATLRGRLDEHSLRLVLSPFFPPASASLGDSKAGTDMSAASAEDRARSASLNYFKSFGELTEQLRTKKNLTLQTRGRWYNEYARKIDALPVLNVDQDLIQLGRDVAETFRGMAVAAVNYNARGELIAQNRVSTMGTAVVNNSGYGAGYGPYGGSGFGYSYNSAVQGVFDNTRQVNNLTAVNQASEGNMRAQSWKNIGEAIGVTRQKMTQKYGVEFPAVRND